MASYMLTRGVMHHFVLKVVWYTPWCYVVPCIVLSFEAASVPCPVKLSSLPAAHRNHTCLWPPALPPHRGHPQAPQAISTAPGLMPDPGPQHPHTCEYTDIVFSPGGFPF